MSQFAVCSVKGAPGATTLALAMTCALAHAHGNDAALVEADPAGGDLAALLGLSTEPGIVSLAAASRHDSARPDIRAHGQGLPAGGWALLGSTDPTQAAATVATLVSRLRHLGEAVRDAVIDGGRWTPSSPISPLLRDVTATVVCLTASVAAIEAVRVRADDLWESTGGRVGLVVIGPDRYGSEQIEACTGVPVVGAVPWDARAYSGLFGAAKTRVERSPIVRAARSIVERLDALAPTTPTVPKPSTVPTSPNGARA